MSGESLMSRHLGSVSELRRSRAYRSIARMAIAGQMLTLLPPMAAIGAAQSPVASLLAARSARAAREADEKVAELRQQLPPGALLSDAPTASAPNFIPSFTGPRTDEEIETLLAPFLLGAKQRGVTAPGDRQEERPARPVPSREPTRVAVNRTVPRVTPRAVEPTLSAAPVDREFFDAAIFTEPLLPTGATTVEDNRALGQVLRQYLSGRNRENVSPVLAHLQRFPASPWRASLLANVGTVFSQHGYYTRAFESWNTAWQLTKDATDPRVRAIADYAVAQWLELMTRFGDVTALEGKMKELEGRKLTGSTGARIRAAGEGLWILKNHHEWATPSARTALASWLYVRSPAYARARARAEMTTGAAAAAARMDASAPLDSSGGNASDTAAFRSPKVLADFHARAEGTSLGELAKLASAAGLRVRPAYRPTGAPLITPAIAHLKPGHYAFVVKEDRGRVLLRDSILGGEIWFSRAALEEESSGYWLIADGPLPDEWRGVEDHESAVVIGRCAPGGADDRDPCGCEGDSPGMPTYTFHPVAASLRLTDTPVGYMPPRGPAANFTLTYNHREVMQPSTFTYSNFGPMWTFDWLSSVNEIPIACTLLGGCMNPFVLVSLRRSGAEDYRNPDVNGVYPAYFRTRAVLVKVSESPVRYERRLPDGSMEVFTQSNGAPSGQRKIFLTSIVDPQGLALQITYDAQLRAVAFTDAIGQVTTVSYDHPADPLKITKVTDPFGRFATFAYTSAGQLASITDVLGLTTSFTYAENDFISAMTTPYGTTTFRHETTTTYPRIIEATDPLGGTEHLEYHYQNTALVNAESAALVPTGFTAFNENLRFYNTFHWNKRQWALHPGDITKAKRTHWLLHDDNPEDDNHGVALSIPLTIKEPLENAVWYAYPGQSSNRWVGSYSKPERVGRVLDDGSSQIFETTFNSRGQVTSRTDAMGRRTSHTYAANGIDLLEVRQTTGALNDLLASYSNYTSLHKAQTTVDAAGESTTYTYNAAGQVLTVTNPKSETTTLTYDTGGFLQSVAGPASGTTVTHTYDGFGRLRNMTDSDGLVSTTDYDSFNRITRVTYPDSTWEETVYDRLDAAAQRDRLGRWTHLTYDPLRRLVAAQDPLGRIVQQTWCPCGSLESVIDAKGQRTRYQYDLQDRVLKEIRADQTTETVYTYETTTSRRKTMTDPKLQVTTYTYHVDDMPQSMVFTNATIATPSVTFGYDSAYSRETSVVDGTGTTTFTYHPPGTLGAGQVASVDGPLTNDTVTHVYDELGRLEGRSVNGVGLTNVYDALGRITTETNPLGTFTYGYEGTSGRLASASYPNGQISTYVYTGLAGDRRLETIHHKRADTSTLSKYDYTFDSAGNVQTWQQQVDSAAAELWQYGYDRVDQLASAVKSSTGGTPAVLKRLAYRYDLAGNRTTEQIDDGARASTYDALNRLVQQAPGGQLRFAGSVNEPATVTIQGKPALVDASNQFSAAVPTVAGSNTVTIQAADPNGNVSSAQYQVTLTGASSTLTYDANGNLTADGTRTFEWDARNQLVAVGVGTHRTEFSYDGYQRRVRVVEKENSIVQSDTRVIWCGTDICEERDATNLVLRRHYDRGVQEGGQSYYYNRDHLSSVVAMTDASGDVRARYEYSPYGEATKTAGDLDSPIGFAGYRAATGGTDLWLTLYRAYDIKGARWTSEDPIGDGDDINRYRYVRNAPIAAIDPLGLFCMQVSSMAVSPWLVESVERFDYTKWDFLFFNNVGGGGPVVPGAMFGMGALNCYWRRSYTQITNFWRKLAVVWACDEYCAGRYMKVTFETQRTSTRERRTETKIVTRGTAFGFQPLPPGLWCRLHPPQ
jgi:RHS repeat-associated protein